MPEVRNDLILQASCGATVGATPWPSRGRRFRWSWGPPAWPATRSSGRCGSASFSARRIPPPWRAFTRTSSERGRHCTLRGDLATRSPTTSSTTQMGICARRATVTNPPSSAPIPATNAVRVALVSQEAQLFRDVHERGADDPATATATIVPSGEYCVISLEDRGNRN